MKDPDILLELLREMANDPYGRMMLFPTFGMDEDKQRRCHHMEILADDGLVEWLDSTTSAMGKQLPRITSAGHDFIEAADKNPPIEAKFREGLELGLPLLQAVSVAMDLAKKLM